MQSSLQQDILFFLLKLKLSSKSISVSAKAVSMGMLTLLLAVQLEFYVRSFSNYSLLFLYLLCFSVLSVLETSKSTKFKVVSAFLEINGVPWIWCTIFTHKHKQFISKSNLQQSFSTFLLACILWCQKFLYNKL